MIYLNEKDIKITGINWSEIILHIEDAVKCLELKDFAQPIKPYLRYREPINRIIAMPAFLGGGFNVAGIKWIASFPKNIQRGKPRAHSVIILNDAESGEPISVINTSVLSIIRTAAVSGIIIKYFDKARTLEDINIGIIGWGPIGQYHFKMCKEMFGNKISNIFLYDIREVNLDSIDITDRNNVHIMNSWEEVYENSDIFITCTVASETYINKKPKNAALLLNVSLRDFKLDVFDYVKDGIIVDDWDEVCRENTDIEIFSKEKGLKREETKSIVDVICKECMGLYPKNQTLMFNPMGMAVFDIAVGRYYYNKALSKNLGTVL